MHLRRPARGANCRVRIGQFLQAVEVMAALGALKFVDGHSISPGAIARFTMTAIIDPAGHISTSTMLGHAFRRLVPPRRKE
jgi:hypothetical protein